MFAIGHMSIGYLFAKGSAKLLKIKINLLLVFILSILPDIDLLIPLLQHRTVTHSIITATIISLPFIALYRTKAIPYFLALSQHSLIGDFITGGANRINSGTQILWPVAPAMYGLPIDVFSLTNIILELTTFMIALGVMWKTKDFKNLFDWRYGLTSKNSR